VDQPAAVKAKSAFREYAEAIIMALILALFIRTFIVQAFKIPSGSMIPTLEIGDHILVNKLSYGLRMPFLERYLLQYGNPARGDVVVFIYPEDRSKEFIKRVIAVAGDTVEVRSKKISSMANRSKTRMVISQGMIRWLAGSEAATTTARKPCRRIASS